MNRRWALVVMGAWLAGTVCMSVVATENFYTIDHLLAGSTNAAFRAAVQQLGQPQARDLLRFLSSELNRLYFQMWNIAQLVLGSFVLWSIWSFRRRAAADGDDLAKPDGPAAWGVAAMVAIVVLMLVWLTPAIVSLGRSLDFVPREPAPPGMQRFWVLHAAYTSLEMFKLAIGGVAAWWIVKSSSRAALVRGVRL